MPQITNVESQSVLVGRQADLVSLESALKEKSLAVVTGTPGVGKTALAVAYARASGERYSLIWKLHFGGGSSLGSDLLALAAKLGLPVAAGPTVMLLNDVRRALRAQDDWLLILDDVASPAEVRHWLDPQSTGHVMATSSAGVFDPSVPQIRLDPLGRAESIELLQSFTGTQDADASKLAMTLADLPIAIVLAGRLMRAERLNCPQYLRRFESRWGELLLESDPGRSRTKGSLSLAVQLSTGHAANRLPESVDLLTFCSFFGSTGAPLDLVRGQFEQPQTAIELLSTLALLQSDDPGILRVPSALLRIVQGTTEADQRDRLALAALKLSTAAFARATGRSGALQLVLTTAAVVDELDIDPQAVCEALSGAGQFLLDGGRHEQAAGVLTRAHAIAAYLYREHDPRLNTLSDSLGRALARSGDRNAAKAHFEKAIEQDSATHGYDHPRVASLVNNYARCHYLSGDVETARQQYEWSLAVIRRHYGPEHQRVAAVINNIGYTHATTGDIVQARTHLEEALRLANRVYPPDHPDIARIASNLGRIALAQRQFEQARTLLERALIIDRQSNGRDHPEVARDLLSLGDCARAAGDHTTAERHYAQAVSVAESSLSFSIDELILYLHRLAKARHLLGDTAGAQQCVQRSQMLRAGSESRLLAAG